MSSTQRFHPLQGGFRVPLLGMRCLAEIGPILPAIAPFSESDQNTHEKVSPQETVGLCLPGLSSCNPE